MSGSVDEGYFNDLSKQPKADSVTPPANNGSRPTDQSELPKTKRIACVICRKRKLKCDGNRPKCATCARLGHNCAYEETRRKSGPKRGYVKELEARLAQVETQLQGKPLPNGRPTPPSRQPSIPEGNEMDEDPTEMNMPMMDTNGLSHQDTFTTHSPYSTSNSNQPLPEAMNNSDFAPDMSFGLDDNFNWEMIGLGLEEPLPTQEAMDELTHTFFEKIHPTEPIIHKYRFYAALSLAPQARPPVTLRYAMWALAAMVTERYVHHADIFYRRARKYLELDEMKGVGEHFVTIGHAQAWIFLSTYEFKLMYFPRAWMSVGRAARLALMMGLNRIDGIGMDVKQCLPPPKDWIEREERRRTFWMAYCVDRYASIGTGWPMAIEEKDIMTNLPASEEAYATGVAEKSQLIKKALTHEEIANLSPMAGVVYVTHFFGLNLTHLHRPEPDDDEENLQGPFWKRHRAMDNVLSNLSLALPSHLRLPANLRDPNVVFINFAAHTSTICLHQAAIFKAQKNDLSQQIADSSRGRCLSSAAEVVNIMRMTSHLDLASMNPYLVFCLYVAARVLVQHMKGNRQDEEVKTSLEFLLTAMAALRKKVPLAESFMIQLQLDIEGSGLDIFLHNPDFSTIVKDKAHLHNSMCNQPSQLSNECLSHGHGQGHSKPADHSQNPIAVDFQIFDSVSPSHDNSNSPPTSNQSVASPQDSSYALNNLDIHALNNASTFYPYKAKDTEEPQGIQGILPGRATWGWSSNQSALQSHDTNLNHPVGLNPLINNNIATNLNTFTNQDLSDMSDPLSRHNSTGLTPQSTNQSLYGGGSSNTSYSPPTIQDEDPLTSSKAVSGAARTTGGGTINPSTTTTATASMNDIGMGDLPQGWENNMSVPSFSTAGMTPTPQEWEKMMQGMPMAWEGGGTGMTPK